MAGNNITRTINYMKRNGIKKAVSAVKERLTAHYDADYFFEPLSEEERMRQVEDSRGQQLRISVLVPAYRTPVVFLRALLDCMAAQTYSDWELVLADASPDDSVRVALETWMQEKDAEANSELAEKIVYRRLDENRGISGNTNQAYFYATGDYIGLLDHDDLLTEDALYEMMKAVKTAKDKGINPGMVYSDEDKTDGNGKSFHTPHFKPDYNPDLLYSNNYICHFLVMENCVFGNLLLRSDFDGAQDYDLVLRAAALLSPEQILHVDKVLYHWRCHDASTADNPASKMYAYEAGKRALQDALDKKRIYGKVRHTEHLGFYRVDYEFDPLVQRADLAGYCGSLVNKKGIIVSGPLREDGSCLYGGLPISFGGPGNKAGAQQDVPAADARTLLVNNANLLLYEHIVGIEYRSLEERDRQWLSSFTEEQWIEKSLNLSAQLDGYIMWDPTIKVRVG